MHHVCLCEKKWSVCIDVCVCVSVRLPASRALELEMYIIILFSQEASHCTLHMHSTYLSPKDSKGSHRHMEK